MSENGMIQKDLVLSINEYAYVLDRTKGNVLCHVGPTKTSLSQSDELVRFDVQTKKFIPVPTMKPFICLRLLQRIGIWF